MEIGMEKNLQKATEEATVDLRRMLPLTLNLLAPTTVGTRVKHSTPYAHVTRCRLETVRLVQSTS